MILPDEPTYWTEVNGSETIYNCLYCEDQQQEHHATDAELFALHMAQRHDGRMLEGSAPVAMAQAQTASNPDDQAPQAGQTGEHPENEPTPPPEQPIMQPVEEAKPEEAGV
jgi:hypothetical protein